MSEFSFSTTISDTKNENFYNLYSFSILTELYKNENFVIISSILSFLELICKIQNRLVSTKEVPKR